MKMPQWTQVCVWMICLAWGVSRCAWAYPMELVALQPETYRSPSGEFTLSVSPTDLRGRGPADCVLRRQGKMVWEKQLPHTLWGAVVSDEGVTAGYAYTLGLDGLGEGGFEKGPGDMVLMILSPTGESLLEERHPRTRILIVDVNLSKPKAYNVLIDGQAKHVIFDIDVSSDITSDRTWWGYELATGKRSHAIKPPKAMPLSQPGDVLRLWDAKPLPGTSLVVTSWKHCPSHEGKWGAWFTLIDLNDPQAGYVWDLKLPGDYSATDEKAQEAIDEKFDRVGGILETTSVPGFSLYAIGQGKRIDFAVDKKEQGGWAVRELGRSDFDSPKPPEQASPAIAPPVIQLKPLGVVKLQAEAPRETKIKDIRRMGMDEAGNICTLTAFANDDARFLYITPEGEVLKELTLPKAEIHGLGEWVDPVGIGRGRFFVMASGGGIDAKAQAFVVDFEGSKIIPRKEFDAYAVRSLAGLPNGKIIALWERNFRYSSYLGLTLFEANGQIAWSQGKDGYQGQPEELLGSRDITVCTDQTMAVLDGSRDTIQQFNQEGKLVRLLELKKIWEQEPRYPTEIAALPQGGFVVLDANALVILDSDGKIQKQWTPRLRDGSAFSPRSICIAPDGRLWATDFKTILRFSQDGAVDRVLGEEAKPDALHGVEKFAVGLDGRVYLADQRTHRIHVFEADGRKVGVCGAEPAELDARADVADIAVAPTGDFYVSMRQQGTRLHFDKSLRRQADVKSPYANSYDAWRFGPSASLCWVKGYTEVSQIGDFQSVERTIKKRPDGRWLERVSGVCTAPDGSVAIRSSTPEDLHWNADRHISTYGPAGEPRGVFAFPPEWEDYGGFAYDGKTVYYAQREKIYLINDQGQCIGVHVQAQSSKDNWLQGPYIAAGGKELWFYGHADRSIHKFAVWDSKQVESAGNGGKGNVTQETP